MKIAFNRQIRRTPWGGGSQFLTVFADFLAAEGHQVVHRLEPGIDWIVMLDFDDGPHADDKGLYIPDEQFEIKGPSGDTWLVRTWRRHDIPR